MRFEEQTGEEHLMQVGDRPEGRGLQLNGDHSSRGWGMGVSAPLICTRNATDGVTKTVYVRDTSHGLKLKLKISPLTENDKPNGAAIYQAGSSVTTLDRPIIYTEGNTDACDRSGVSAQVVSEGNNVLSSEPEPDSKSSTCSAKAPTCSGCLARPACRTTTASTSPRAR